VSAGMVRSSDFAALRVADVMSLDPVVVRVDDSLETAERLLSAYRIGGLPVVNEDGRLVGVISKTDLLPQGTAPIEALLRGRRSGIRVGELMSAPALTVALAASLTEAARVMHDAHVHRVVVVGDDGRPLGVLAASDFVAMIAEA